ncbi:MAG: hypothetical protein K5849_07410 [Bacteroidales bacterium]|nr:hypothetical protein [Bacteroidales bacterium]
MEAKSYRAMQRAQGKMLREYFSGVPVENLSKRYGYSVVKIKKLATEYKQGKIDIFDNPPQQHQPQQYPTKSKPATTSTVHSKTRHSNTQPQPQTT